MEGAAKRQRVHPPARAADELSPISMSAKRQHNGPCCGGDKVAGTGPGYKLGEFTQIKLAERTKASWVRESDKAVVATKCGSCKKIIVPTDEQCARMERFKLKSVREEVELCDFESKTGMAAEDAVAFSKDIEQM